MNRLRTQRLAKRAGHQIGQLQGELIAARMAGTQHHEADQRLSLQLVRHADGRGLGHRGV